MKKTLVISLLLFVWMLTACGNDSDDSEHKELTPAQKIEKMEDSGELPKLERTNTVNGIDADKNGIRDDIDAYIKKTYPSKAQQQAVNQYAKGLQASLLVDKKDKIALKAVTNEKARAISCISTQVPNGNSPNGDRVVKEILSMSTNTKQRLKKYLELDQALDGTVISLPSGDVCDE